MLPAPHHWRCGQHDKVLERYQRIDVLVNNAAINDMFENPLTAKEQSMFEHYPLEQWNRSWNVNVSGMFLCSQVMGMVMAGSGWWQHHQYRLYLRYRSA